MRVLGIDPGTSITGYACVELPRGLAQPRLLEAGVLRMAPRSAIHKRLRELHHGMEELIAQWKPDRVAVEKLYAHYKHPHTAIQMAHARGVILLAAARADLEVMDLPATMVKKSLTGNGHATKDQVQKAVAAQFRLKEPPSPPDVADAVAIALCALRR